MAGVSCEKFIAETSDSASGKDDLVFFKKSLLLYWQIMKLEDGSCLRLLRKWAGLFLQEVGHQILS